ncbi:MAG: HAD family hydrolase [Nitriliruptoraceae bacterium]
MADLAPSRDAPGPTAPRVVAFDIGEVLVDESRVWATWAELVGSTPLTFAAVLGAAIVQGEDHRAVFGHIAPNVDWLSLQEEHERRLGGLQEQDLYGDVRACLQALHRAEVRIVIAGNQPARRRPQLEALALAVDDLVTSDDLGVEKPDPTFFTRLLERSSVERPGELLYVGDRVDNDILPALEIGIATCWLRRGPWGLLQDMPDGVEADIVLEGLGELPDVVASWSDA